MSPLTIHVYPDSGGTIGDRIELARTLVKGGKYVVMHGYHNVREDGSIDPWRRQPCSIACLYFGEVPIERQEVCKWSRDVDRDIGRIMEMHREQGACYHCCTQCNTVGHLCHFCGGNIKHNDGGICIGCSIERLRPCSTCGWRRHDHAGLGYHAVAGEMIDDHQFTEEVDDADER